MTNDGDSCFQGNLFELRNQKASKAYYVNVSEPLTEVSAKNVVVKVYGEANPSKTDEELLDIETNTQILHVGDHKSSSPPSDKITSHLSVSGYGPPVEDSETGEMDQQTETIIEMQASPLPDVENPYGGGIPDTDAEQRAITVETSSTSNIEKESELPTITNTEQAVTLSKSATYTTKYEKGFREAGVGTTKSDLSEAELTEDTTEACAEGCKASTESLMGTAEVVTELSETSTDTQEGNTGSSTSDSEESYGISTEQLESKSISTEAVKVEKTASILEEYGTVPETVTAETVSKAERKGTPNEGTEVTLSELESSTNDDITYTQTKSVDLQTGAEDFGYGVGAETIKEQFGAKTNLSSTSGNLPEAYKVEPTVIADEPTVTAYNATISPVTGEETKYTEQNGTYENAELDLRTQRIYPSQERITKVSEDTYQYQKSAARTETTTYPNLSQSTLLETEMSTNQSTLTSHSLAVVEVDSELVTSSTMSSTSVDTSYTITEGVNNSKIVSSTINEPAEDIPGYETSIRPEDIVTSSKTALPGLNKESASQLSKSIEEASTLSKMNMETEMASEKAVEALEGTVAEPKDLKSSTESSEGGNETTGFIKEASLTSVEQLPKYSEVTPKYIAQPTYRKEEAMELQKTSEGNELSSTAPYDTETGHVEEKAVSGDTSVTSNGVFISAEYGTDELFMASERLSESKESTTASEGIMTGAETSEISKSDEGLAGYGEAGPSEEVSNTDASIESGLEKTTQSGELLTRTSMVSEQYINHNDEISTPETIINEMKFYSTTAFVEQTVPRETTRSEEQSSGYGELPLTTDGFHESSKEITSEKTTTLREQVKEYGLLTSSQGVATSEADVTTGKALNVTESTSSLRGEYTDKETYFTNSGYGGGEERITENEYLGNSRIDTSLNSVSITGAEKTAENPNSSELYIELSENAGAREAAYIKEAGVTGSSEQLASAGMVATSRSHASAPGYAATGNLFNSSDYYSATEGTTNKLSKSDEETVLTTVPAPKTNKIASVDEGITNLASLTSKSSEPESSGYAVSEGEKYTETPTGETLSVPAESDNISTNKNDSGYGDGLGEVTEAKIIGQTQDSKTLVAIVESTLATQRMQFIDQTKTESVQQSSAIETSSVGRSTEIETSSTIESAETSLQYPVDIKDITTSSDINNQAIKTVEVPETGTSTVSSQTYSQHATESTFMHIITDAVEMPLPYSINEEVPKVIAMTKVLKTGPSKLTVGTITTGKETAKKSNLKTIEEFEAESTKSAETSSEVRNEMGTISSETTWVSPESVRTTAGNTESGPAKIPMGPEDFGYGNGKEVNTFISSSSGSVMTTRPELLSSSEQTNLIETYITPESPLSSEYVNSGTFTESESKSSEEFSSATVPSVTLNASMESFTITQKMLTIQGELITKEDINDGKNTPSRIPTGPKDFGYGDDVEEVNSEVSSPSTILEGNF